MVRVAQVLKRFGKGFVMNGDDLVLGETARKSAMHCLIPIISLAEQAETSNDAGHFRISWPLVISTKTGLLILLPRNCASKTAPAQFEPRSNHSRKRGWAHSGRKSKMKNLK